jgi:hypothetical protein
MPRPFAVRRWVSTTLQRPFDRAAPEIGAAFGLFTITE